MSHGHDHHHHNTAPQSGVRLLAALLLTGSIMVAEVVGAWWSGALSLFADAGHMLTDLSALLVAFAASRLASRPADDRRTYGYRRLEVLAALLNGVALVGISAVLGLAAFLRLRHPAPVDTHTMGLVALVGLVANLIGLWLLHGGAHDINTRAAFLHVLGDTLSSVGVLVGAWLIDLTGVTAIDPILSLGIALLIVVSSLRMLRDVIDVLLESAPRGIQTDLVRRSILAVPGVQQIHDLHIWSITSGMPALSCHVILCDPSLDGQEVLQAILRELRTTYHIEHATLQLELGDAQDCGC